MGTNFYAVTDDGTFHLGKRSAGWRFLFRSQPERFTTLRELVGWLENTPHRIVDEYDREHDTVEWMRMAKSWGDDWELPHRHGLSCPCGMDPMIHGRRDHWSVQYLVANDYSDIHSDTDWCRGEFS